MFYFNIYFKDLSSNATSTSAPSINTVHKILNLKEFTLFCCEFENVVNRAFLVLIFWVQKLVGANFYAFSNYAVSSSPSIVMKFLAIN